MAPSFGRSISFPLSPARSSSSSNSKAKQAAARHVRSISLPCRSHPLLAHLRTHIAAVRDWTIQPASASAGLAHINALHAAIAELLLLPEAQDAVRSSSSDRLMDALLVLADAHQGFQEMLLTLKADVADVQAALRRRDAARLASAVRSQRRNDKDLARLAVSLSSKTTKLLGLAAAAEETEMMMDAAAASAAASAAVFSAVASMSASSSSSSSSSKKTVAFAAAFTRKETAVDQEKLQDLAQCILNCETGSENVFRTIVRTRVSLLNIRTPAI